VEKRIETYANKYYFTKDPDWGDENEYRIIVRNSSSEHLYVDIDGCLEDILLGLNYNASQVDVLKMSIESFREKPSVEQLILVNNNFMTMPIST